MLNRLFFTTVLSSVLLFVADTAFATDLIVPISQDRNIVGTAYASDYDGTYEDSADDSATDFGAFDSGAAADVILDGAIGSGGGSQQSAILPNGLTAVASQFANGECWEFGYAAGGTSINRFDVTFDLSADAEYSLTGGLGRFDSGYTTLEFSGPGGLIIEITPDRNMFEPFAESGTVPAGRYRLFVVSSGLADGFDFESDYASGEFDVTLMFQTPTSVPDLAGSGFLHAFPNPFDTEATIALDSSGAESALLDGVQIIDTSGRVLRTLDMRDRSENVVWNGQDERGVDVPPGIYFLRADFGPTRGVVVQKLLRVH